VLLAHRHLRIIPQSRDLILHKDVLKPRPIGLNRTGDQGLVSENLLLDAEDVLTRQIPT
jgi:hypothetical protein